MPWVTLMGTEYLTYLGAYTVTQIWYHSSHERNDGTTEPNYTR